MIIESVDITSFGKLSDYKVSFDGGFNLLEGNNESGKSTLSAFLVYMLYGFPDGDGGEERALRTPFSKEETAGSMVFSVADARYRIERHSLFGKNGWRDSFSLRNLTTGEVENEGTSPGERFLGVSRKVFMETAFFGIGRMGALDGETVCGAIENIVFSGDERQSVARAAYALRDAADRLFSTEGSGILRALEKEREELEERLKEARGKELSLYEKEELLYVNRKKRDDAMAELEKFTSLETNYYNAVMIKDYDRLHELEDATALRDKAVSDFIAAHKKGDAVPDLAYLTELAAAKAAYDGAQKAKDMARLSFGSIREGGPPVTADEQAFCRRVEEAGGTDVLRQRAEKGKKRMRCFSFAALLCLVAFLGASIAFGLVLAGGSSTVAVLFASLGVVALGAFAVTGGEWLRAAKEMKRLYALCDAVKHEEFLSLLSRAAELSRTAETWESDRKKAAELVELSEHSFEETRERLSSLVSRMGGKEEDESLVDAATRIGKSVADFLEGLSALKHEKEAAEAEVRLLRGKLADKNEIAVRARVAPADRERYCNQNVDDLRRGVEHFEDLLKKLLQAENELVTELSHLEVGEASASVAERIAVIDERIAGIKEKGRVYRLAAEAVEGGIDRLREEIAPRLSFGAGNLLYEMTDGRYTEILTDEKMSLSFMAEDGPRDARHLGDATAEMAYISLRIALIDLLYRKELPPLCFDGCTAIQDKERAMAFMRALRGVVSEGKQCFCFTADERERRFADKIFTSYRYLAMEK